MNHECLSITDTNMRAEVLADLFARVGGSDLWPRVSEQASLKAYFQEAESTKVDTKARRKLNDLMDLRNKIEHPSREFEWPSTESLRDYLHFLRLLSRAMADLVGVFEVTLCSPEPTEPKVEPAPYRTPGG